MARFVNDTFGYIIYIYYLGTIYYFYHTDENITIVN